MKTRHILSILVLLCLAVPGLSWGQLPPAPYTYVTLNVPNPVGDQAQTMLLDAGATGELVGAFADNSASGFSLGDRLRYRELRCAPFPAIAIPNSIVAGFTIAGNCFVDGTVRGFLRHRVGKRIVMTPVSVPGAQFTDLRGLSVDKKTCGAYFDGTTYRGFIRLPDGTIKTLNAPFPEAAVTVLTGINTRGDVVGFTATGLEDGQPNGFIMRAPRKAGGKATWARIVPPGSLPWVLPQDIAEDGTIVGIYVDASDGNLKSFLLLPDGQTYQEIRVPFAGALFTEVGGTGEMVAGRPVLAGRYILHEPTDTVNPFRSYGFVATPALGAPAIAPSLAIAATTAAVEEPEDEGAPLPAATPPTAGMTRADMEAAGLTLMRGVLP